MRIEKEIHFSDGNSGAFSQDASSFPVSGLFQPLANRIFPLSAPGVRRPVPFRIGTIRATGLPARAKTTSSPSVAASTSLES